MFAKLLKRVIPQDIFSNSSIPSKENEIPSNEYSVFSHQKLKNYYHQVIISAEMIGRLSVSSQCSQAVVEIMRQLEPDEYTEYLVNYYQAGIDRFGANWTYSDLLTVLWATSQLIRPKSYLEIGVRRGRSMAVIAATAQNCHMVGFDMWISDYADMPNPGGEFVQNEMEKFQKNARIDLITGNSHKTVPEYFAAHPDEYFDIITVDGDHSELGAEADLKTVIPHIKVGGALVFDDICHPQHPYLQTIWKHTVGIDPRFTTWEYMELGYGVAVAVRREE